MAGLPHLWRGAPFQGSTTTASSTFWGLMRSPAPLATTASSPSASSTSWGSRRSPAPLATTASSPSASSTSSGLMRSPAPMATAASSPSASLSGPHGAKAGQVHLLLAQGAPPCSTLLHPTLVRSCSCFEYLAERIPVLGTFFWTKSACSLRQACRIQ